MFSEVTKYYDWRDASLEIIIIILTTFVLGFLFGYFLKKWSRGQVSKDVENLGDDFSMIIWITKKIEKLLKKKNIDSFKELSDLKQKDLTNLLKKAKLKFDKSNVKTWSDQAKLAENSCWWELKEYQDLLDEGNKK